MDFSERKIKENQLLIEEEMSNCYICYVCGKYLDKDSGSKCSRCKKIYDLDCVTGLHGDELKTDYPWCMEISPPIEPIASQYSEEEAAISEASEQSQHATQASGLKRELMAEIRMFRQEMKEMKDNMSEFRTEIAEIKQVVQMNTNKIGDMMCQVSTIEQHVTDAEVTALFYNELQNFMRRMNCQMNEKEQELLINDVEITGIAESRNETMIQIIRLIAEKIQTDINETDVVLLHRIGHRRVTQGNDMPRPRRLVIRFTCQAMKERVIHAAKAQQINTGDPNRVYINERLTKHNRNLFWKLRHEAKRFQWRYVWTKHGKIFARQCDGEPALKIQVYQDIFHAFNNIDMRAEQESANALDADFVEQEHDDDVD